MISKEESNKIVAYLEVLHPIISLGMKDLSLFKKALDQLEEIISNYEAIGFISSKYMDECELNKVRLLRMKSILNLLKVYSETQETISNLKKKNRNLNEISFLK